ncbi:hypothetical protein BUL40_15600 [Croceivirga radicis]|uniref:Uncharacterized protein n=1 Tax=Croceivirga radicis TaxID=1929488 RepID=A0A1V6LMT7_9FLAO|nr:hypothetical protein [Croceivirga radicis]OQD41501.1 hypothetical protein BUL40_15600 [Croceivirga radicis]
MIGKILGVLSYGSKIEKYALSAQIVAKALQTCKTELEQVWQPEPKKTVKETAKKVVKNVLGNDNEKVKEDAN